MRFVEEDFEPGAIVPIEALEQAKERMRGEIQSACAADVPGDTHRNLRVNTRHSGRTFKHILVPVWILSFTYRQKIYQVLVNGYSGKIAGDYPLSWWKVFFLAVVVLIAVIIVLSLQE